MVYRAGIIGTGGIAGMGILGLHEQDDIGSKKVRSSHAGGYTETPNVELNAVADVDEQKLETFGKAWDIPSEQRYVGHESMLESENLDIVSVCTPTYLHREHVIDAALSSASPSAIWCEKPIASSIADAEEMISVCDAEGIELIVNHSFRFTTKIQQLRSLLADGLIGEIKAVNAQFRRELLRNSTHLLDTLAFLVNSRPVRVSGYVNEENDAVDALDGRDVDDAGGGGFVVLEDGTFVTIDCTVAREISSMSIELIGTEGKLYLNNDDGVWQYWRLEDGSHVEAPLPGIESAWSWDTDYEEAFPNAAGHIVDLLEGRDDNLSSGEEAFQSVEIIIGFFLSHNTGSQVDLPIDPSLQDITITSW
ncbi:Gfo/Idh/MocA family oxidoreductase [Halomontanus rarus]|uniref:Gfo/Idh/MocA family protein n=1 Tax=Halomontanus rarus TaxID=3034020 RepID=UPI00293BBEB4|nr:Gfo/Idh/MocA family oxidoreductase [Halovivax sp. KZCA124]